MSVDLLATDIRFYDPATGQFLTRDPANAATRSAYGYVYGNPLNGSDPAGLFVVGTCGDFSIGFIVYVSLQGCFVSDGENVALVGFAGAGGASPTVSSTGGVFVSNAATVDDLRGETWCVGGAVGEAVVGGLEFCRGRAAGQYTGVWSAFGSLGSGLEGLPFVEGHGTVGYTGVTRLPRWLATMHGIGGSALNCDPWPQGAFDGTTTAGTTTTTAP